MTRLKIQITQVSSFFNQYARESCLTGCNDPDPSVTSRLAYVRPGRGSGQSGGLGYRQVQHCTSRHVIQVEVLQVRFTLWVLERVGPKSHYK